jgi:hypothetical protein
VSFSTAEDATIVFVPAALARIRPVIETPQVPIESVSKR